MDLEAGFERVSWGVSEYQETPPPAVQTNELPDEYYNETCDPIPAYIRSRAPPPKFKSPMVVELNCWLSAHTHELVGCLNLMCFMQHRHLLFKPINYQMRLNTYINKNIQVKKFIPCLVRALQSRLSVQVLCCLAGQLLLLQPSV